MKATRGYAQVVGQPDASGAKEILRRQSFDAIIIRLRDSNADGAELIRALAAQGDQDHLVVVTPKIEEVQAARLLGIRECLSPACRSGELWAAISRCAQSVGTARWVGSNVPSETP